MMSLFGYLILDYCPKEADNVQLSSTKLVESEILQFAVRDQKLCIPKCRNLY